MGLSRGWRADVVTDFLGGPVGRTRIRPERRAVISGLVNARSRDGFGRVCIAIRLQPSSMYCRRWDDQTKEELCET